MNNVVVVREIAAKWLVCFVRKTRSKVISRQPKKEEKKEGSKGTYLPVCRTKDIAALSRPRPGLHTLPGNNPPKLIGSDTYSLPGRSAVPCLGDSNRLFNLW